MTTDIAYLDESNAAGWERTLYAFLAETQRRSDSQRTVQSYSRMLRDSLRAIMAPRSKSIGGHKEKLVSAIYRLEDIRLPIPFTPWQLRSFAYIERSLPGHRGLAPKGVSFRCAFRVIV